jgi:hypothetical protein
MEYPFFKAFHGAWMKGPFQYLFIPAAGYHACVPKRLPARSVLACQRTCSASRSAKAGTSSCRHGLWPWKNGPSCGRDVAPHRRRTGVHGPSPWGSIGILGGIFVLLHLAVFSSGCSNEKSGKPVSAPIPVIVSTVIQKTVPVQLRAIGNVQAYSTVTIKSKVGGELVRVHFTEGQDVKKGAPLFTIDPRPYEAALKQVEANLERDLVQAKNAQEDAQRYESTPSLFSIYTAVLQFTLRCLLAEG